MAMSEKSILMITIYMASNWTRIGAIVNCCFSSLKAALV